MRGHRGGRRLGHLFNRYIWQSQLPVDYIDNSLTINNWETIVADLSGGDPARLWWIIVEQTNNGAAVENFELEITINGTAYTFAQAAAVSGTQYFGLMYYTLTAGDFTPLFTTSTHTVGNPVSTAQGIPFTAETVSLIRIRQTTAVDVVAASLEVNIVWDLLVGL